MWLAATDEKQEGKFFWENSQIEVYYTNFMPKQPNNKEVLDTIWGKYYNAILKTAYFLNIFETEHLHKLIANNLKEYRVNSVLSYSGSCFM